MCRPHLYLKSVSQATWQARLRVHFSFPLFVFRSTLFSQRSEEHTSELQSQSNLVCRLLLEKKKNVYSRSACFLTSYPVSSWAQASAPSGPHLPDTAARARPCHLPYRRAPLVQV